MKKLRLLLCLIIATGAAHPVMADRAYDVTKPLLGGLVGGLIGSTIGSGSGKNVAIAIGSTLGAVYGHKIAHSGHRRLIHRGGRSLHRAYYVPHALHAPTPRINWRPRELDCRVVDQLRSKSIYACRDRSGSWRILQ